MTACADWLAAEFLHRHGHPHPDPPCDHDPQDCPPLEPEENA
jgi:hypothetical protein